MQHALLQAKLAAPQCSPPTALMQGTSKEFLKVAVCFSIFFSAGAHQTHQWWAPAAVAKMGPVRDRAFFGTLGCAVGRVFNQVFKIIDFKLQCSGQFKTAQACETQGTVF